MPVAFISDLHLTPERPESMRRFQSFTANARGRIDQLYILGDLFEFWIGDDGRDLLGYAPVERDMAALTADGVEVFFIHGNRDFLVGEDFARRTGCRILPDPSVIKLDGAPVLLTHGDTLCTDDVEHQQARERMVTGKWKFAFLGKPVDERLDTATRMRRESEAGKKAKSMQMMDVNPGQVERVMREHGVNVMIHGHTHKPAVHELEIDGRPARRYVLGDWFEQDSILLHDNGCFTLKR